MMGTKILVAPEVDELVADAVGVSSALPAVERDPSSRWSLVPFHHLCKVSGLRC